jgi:hypothetical protein
MGNADLVEATHERSVRQLPARDSVFGEVRSITPVVPRPRSVTLKVLAIQGSSTMSSPVFLDADRHAHLVHDEQMPRTWLPLDSEQRPQDSVNLRKRNRLRQPTGPVR